MHPADAKTRELATVCYLYYRRGLTQTEIAGRLGKSNMTVSRLLREARDRGIVQFRLTVPCPSDPQVEARLKSAFDGLDDAIAVENELLDANHLKRRLGQAAAGYLPFFLKEEIHIGIGGGDTLAHLVEAFDDPMGLTGITVVQLTGDTGAMARLGNETLTTQRLSEKLGGEGFFCPIPSPLDQRSLEDGEQLLARFGSKAKERWDRIDVGVVGIGTLQSRVSPSREGYVSEAQFDRLRKRGAVGDILLHFFGLDGRVVDTTFDDTVTAISWEQLERVETLIAVAGGDHKAEAILAALRSGRVNVLITDRDTALRVLEIETADCTKTEKREPPCPP